MGTAERAKETPDRAKSLLKSVTEWIEMSCYGCQSQQAAPKQKQDVETVKEVWHAGQDFAEMFCILRWVGLHRKLHGILVCHYHLLTII